MARKGATLQVQPSWLFFFIFQAISEQGNDDGLFFLFISRTGPIGRGEGGKKSL